MLEIKPLQQKDSKKAIQYAIKGMQFEQYIPNRFLLQVFGYYFWYKELLRATEIIAAYDGEHLVGVLLAEMNGGTKKCKSWWRESLIKTIDKITKTFFGDSAGEYDRVNKEMYADYVKHHTPDGEIVCLASDVNHPVRGIGTLLMKEFKARVQGQEVFLYTDSNCSYPFYEKRGFDRKEARDITMIVGDHASEVTCFLYARTF